MITRYCFDTFELHPDQRQLFVGGRETTLGARAFDVLLALSERAGRLVSKNELLDCVWPGVVVEENNLQVQISTLRKVLGPEAIATIPGRGYRLTKAPADAASHAALPEPMVATARDSGVLSRDVFAEAPVLYGRGLDVAAVCEQIQRLPLVTVIGPPGIGKTRLAHAVGHACRPAFADRVHLADLASLADPALVPVTVAHALGVEAGGAASAIELVIRAIAGQRLLLVVDNCEHVLEAVDAVVDALRARAPAVHILATSQEVLRHVDEHIYRLGPLAVPNSASLSSASTAGAIELFVARTQAVEPRFTLNESNAGGVVEICRRLDGIPLAIELAAARVPFLGLEGVRERLDERFRLLTAGSRIALRRHQTLRAALEWSYALLTKDEQNLLLQLGVFAGSFSLESAQQLAADEESDAWAVLDHLGALVDKSLVSVEAGENPRYRLLETTRAFALEQLTVDRATSRTMRRHAQVMLALFAKARDEKLHVASLDQAVAKLMPDLDNLRAALRWASATEGDRTIAAALFGASACFLQDVAGKAEAFALSTIVRAVVDESVPAVERARFCCACADVEGQMSPEVAIGDAQRALALYQELDDRLGAYLSQRALAFAFMNTNRPAEAGEAVAALLRLRDLRWAPWVRAWGDNIAALSSLASGDLDIARHHALAFLSSARQYDSFKCEQIARAILCEVDVLSGRALEAAEAASAGLARYRASPTSVEDGLNLRVFAGTLMNADRLDEAEAAYREALPRIRRSFGNSGLLLYDAATLVALRGRVDDAARVRGYAAGTFAATGRSPRKAAQDLEKRLLALLSAQRSADVLDALAEEGRRLTDDQACELAFPTTSKSVVALKVVAAVAPGRSTGVARRSSAHARLAND